MNEKHSNITFRKEALKKLYSSEDLERVLYVVKPINWIALIILFLAWMLISGVVVVSVAMMSSRLSKAEEARSTYRMVNVAERREPDIRSNRIPTRPRAEAVR